MENYYGFDEDMFTGGTKIDFHGFKNGEHKFRVLPPYAPGKLFLQVDLHWGFTDENGRKKALKCTKYSHKTCAICDEVDRLKGELELLKQRPTSTPEEKAELTKLIEAKESRIGEIKKKPTYLWNILTEEGAQKVLQLSWNGHEPLLNKVKFYWEQKKINVTDVNNNYLIWCSRTGEKAKTRYAYEVLEQNVRKLEGLKPLVDLSKVYKESTPQELKAIVDQGFVGLPDEDPNDRDFTAQMPSGVGNAANSATPSAGQTNSGAQTQSSSPVGTTTTAQQAASPSETAKLSEENKAIVDEEAARLMAMLQG